MIKALSKKTNFKKWLKRISFGLIIIAFLIGLSFGIYWLVETKIPQSKGETFIKRFEEDSKGANISTYVRDVEAIIENPDTFNTGSAAWNLITEDNFKDAVKPKLEQLAYSGNKDAAYLMGNICGTPSFHLANNGRVYYDERDVKAAFYYRIAADGGHPKAQAMLAKYYMYGKGVSKNYIEAYEWASKSANQNCAHGMTLLGKLYSTGIYGGIPQFIVNDHPKLFDDNGVTLSRKFTYDNVILRPNINMSRKLWKKALDLGDEEAKEYFEKVYTDEQISKDPNIDYDAY